MSPWKGMTFWKKVNFILFHADGHIGCGGTFQLDNVKSPDITVEHRTCDTCGKGIFTPLVCEVF